MIESQEEKVNGKALKTWSFMKNMKFAYWSVGILAILNLAVFVSSLTAAEEITQDTGYLHYNLVLAIGYALVFLIGRKSKSPVCLGLAVFLFAIGLVVSRDITASLQGPMVQVWLWSKWLLLLPIMWALISAFKALFSEKPKPFRKSI